MNFDSKYMSIKLIIYRYVYSLISDIVPFCIKFLFNIKFHTERY